MKIKKVLWGMVIGAAVITIGVFTFLICTNYSEQKKALTEKQETENNAGFDKNLDYAFETSYTGEPHLSDKLFQTPFQKSDLYICNKDLLPELGEENAEILTEKAKKITDIIFNTPYKDKVSESVAEELAGYLSQGIFIIAEDGTEYHGKENTAKSINQWFVDTKTTMESSLQTDICMVYYDEHCIIVRGLLTYNVYETEDMEELERSFGQEDIQFGKDNACLMEFYFIPDESRTDYDSYVLSTMNDLLPCGI